MKSKGVVLGLYGPNGLGVVRSLGVENIPVVGFHMSSRFPHASYSKYLDEKFFVDNNEELLNSLINFGEKQSEKGVVFCTGDDYALFVEKNSDILSKYFHLPLSEYGNLEDIVDKSKILEIGKKSGFIIPSYSKLSEDSVFAIEYPVFLKPLYSFKGSKFNMQVVETKEKLRELRESLLDKFIDLEVETFIPGSIENQIEVHTYLTSKGIPLIAGMLQYQTDFIGEGYGNLTGWSEKTIYHEELVEPSNNLTKLLKFKGPLDINLKQSSKDGKFYFNEVNLRSSANLMIDTKFGLNLPAIIYKDLNGEDFNYLSSKFLQLDKYWISDRRIIGYTEKNIPIDLDKLNYLMKQKNAYSFFDEQDPAPFYMSLAKGELSGFNVEIDFNKK